MVSFFVSMFVAATVGQAQDQEAWLKSVPADVAVVARVKALKTVQGDLQKMLEAMSGNAAAMAGPQIEQMLAMMEAQTGKPSVEHPFFVLMNLPKDGPMPGWAVMVESENYEGVIKSITKKDDIKLEPKDGVASFDSPDGQTWYSTQGKGFVAFGPDQAIIKSVIKPSASLDEKVGGEIKKELLGGDLGIYVNVASIQGQYGDQIEQGKQMFLGLMDQGGGQLDAKTLESAKAIYGAMFDSIKSGEALALHFDFGAEGLGLSGMITVKGDSEVAKSLASAKGGSAAGLGKLPADAMMFTYVSSSPEAARNLAKLASPGGKIPDETEKILALNEAAGIQESYVSIADGVGGFSGIAALAYSVPKDPAKAEAAAALQSQSAKTSGQMMFKSVDITPKAETYKGFTLSRAKMTLDLDKMTPPNAPGGVENMKKLMGGDVITSWFGTDGKTFVNLGGKTFDQAKARLDAFLTGEGAVGKTKAFESIRAKLPENVTGVVLVSAQGLVRMVAQVVTAMTPNQAAVPADMPKDTALFGGSLTSSPKGYQFRFIVPSAVGPVMEKGLVPMLQSLGAVAQ